MAVSKGVQVAAISSVITAWRSKIIRETGNSTQGRSLTDERACFLKGLVVTLGSIVPVSFIREICCETFNEELEGL